MNLYPEALTEVVQNQFKSALERPEYSRKLKYLKNWWVMIQQHTYRSHYMSCIHGAAVFSVDDPEVYDELTFLYDVACRIEDMEKEDLPMFARKQCD